jgi:hypothetical protein
MTNEHLITPPPELMHQWVDMLSSRSDQAVFTMAAQWGADQELEACCELTRDNEGYDAALRLRGSRRPKPPSLKEQALADLDSMSIEPCLINGIDTNALVRAKYDNIRRALEALDD